MKLYIMLEFVCLCIQLKLIHKTNLAQVSKKWVRWLALFHITWHQKESKSNRSDTTLHLPVTSVYYFGTRRWTPFTG
jgi:hypothetical protein